jgi:hypothetical protein
MCEKNFFLSFAETLIYAGENIVPLTFEFFLNLQGAPKVQINKTMSRS